MDIRAFFSTRPPATGPATASNNPGANDMSESGRGVACQSLSSRRAVPAALNKAADNASSATYKRTRFVGAKQPNRLATDGLGERVPSLQVRGVDKGDDKDTLTGLRPRKKHRTGIASSSSLLSSAWGPGGAAKKKKKKKKKNGNDGGAAGRTVLLGGAASEFSLNQTVGGTMSSTSSGGSPSAASASSRADTHKTENKEFDPEFEYLVKYILPKFEQKSGCRVKVRQEYVGGREGALNVLSVLMRFYGTAGSLANQCEFLQKTITGFPEISVYSGASANPNTSFGYPCAVPSDPQMNRSSSHIYSDLRHVARASKFLIEVEIQNFGDKTSEISLKGCEVLLEKKMSKCFTTQNLNKVGANVSKISVPKFSVVYALFFVGVSTQRPRGGGDEHNKRATKTTKHDLGISKWALGEDKYTLGEDAQSRGTHARSLGLPTVKFVCLHCEKKGIVTEKMCAPSVLNIRCKPCGKVHNAKKHWRRCE